MEIDKAVIGNKIRNLRKSKNWSQKEFALKIGLTQSSITEIEKGKKLASMNKIYKILVYEQFTVFLVVTKLFVHYYNI